MKTTKSVLFTIVFSLLCIYIFAQKDRFQSIPDFKNGTIVSSNFASVNGSIEQSSRAYDPKIFGVYYKPESRTAAPTNDLVPIPVPEIITNGIVLVRFNSENGLIKQGDPLTSSSIPGEAMKATSSGVIIGIALEDANANTGLVQTRILIQYLNN